MIISHAHKFCFVKTKKTAGTSIEVAMLPHLKEGDWRSPPRQSEPQLRSMRSMSKSFVALLRSKDTNIRARSNHLSATVIEDYLKSETEGYTRFCVERNSWDKAIYAFYFWISRHGASKTQTDEQNFAEFAEGPRMGWFSDFDLYTRAGIPIVDHIVSYENLDAEFAEGDDTVQIT